MGPLSSRQVSMGYQKVTQIMRLSDLLELYNIQANSASVFN